MYDATRFRKEFRMARPLFKRIINAVTNRDAYFHSNVDCTGREGISSLIKCTSAIHQLTYNVNASFLDEYMQMSKRSSCTALDHFCQAVMEIYGPEYLRKPTVTNIEKLYRHHEEKHGIPGILGSLDCTDWEWFSFPYTFKGQYVRRDHGLNLFILLEVVASQDLWIWHIYEKVHLGIKVGANSTVTGVPGQEGAEGNVAEKKKVKESIKSNIRKLLKYKAWLTRRSPVRVFSIG
uniref:Uncharacterized protein n=1 Tax=Tanacetum cinerariifolium TaxID=118510 RepID=A0A6L2MJJ6_TANCI|nr:hypothetical protein [Tanacetum cinerariifolium]